MLKRLYEKEKLSLAQSSCFHHLLASGLLACLILANLKALAIWIMKIESCSATPAARLPPINATLTSKC